MGFCGISELEVFNQSVMPSLDVLKHTLTLNALMGKRHNNMLHLLNHYFPKFIFNILVVIFTSASTFA